MQAAEKFQENHQLLHAANLTSKIESLKYKKIDSVLISANQK
jgi:hypothetical protein